MTDFNIESMDGVNEKGFAVSFLYLDLKEGEHPVNQTEKGKESVILSVLLFSFKPNTHNKIITGPLRKVRLLHYTSF